MKLLGWGFVAASFVFLSLIVPGFTDGLAGGSARVGVVGWVLLAAFLILFLMGIWLLRSRDEV